MTWILFFVNAAMMTINQPDLKQADEVIQQAFDDKYFISQQGRYFAQFIADHESFYSPFLKQISFRALGGELEKIDLLGALALRNQKFMEEGPSYPFGGDRVALSVWHKKIENLISVQAEHPNYYLGITADHLSWSYWFTYQFVHSGLSHFAFNMVFLIIFGCFLEVLKGGLFVLIVYLGSGFAGAGFFLLINGPTMAPLIGASAAVSGLMA
ncbi:MAG: rhomboid family intramembrane serine protease, partial [Bdellovibrionales bacterium]|nr:rhomboid family intramembrane serine protease [Bdellovibrionales bacterium]